MPRQPPNCWATMGDLLVLLLLLLLLLHSAPQSASGHVDLAGDGPPELRLPLRRDVLVAVDAVSAAASAAVAPLGGGQLGEDGVPRHRVRVL